MANRQTVWRSSKGMSVEEWIEMPQHLQDNDRSRPVTIAACHSAIAIH
ncbi:hypothetical protein H6F67_18265 [Microcoleus sp. FACHB-1515]|nr:hypothetical protein [Microcoleus sp. FACHB-1515]MBD2091791.1 hypothetical protein [Microcoleus sp. FACHB-1515]